uniref:PSI domain-containing protein n=1 Tax=Felis catus TaxID=9685 RepID=A0ABI7ZWQ5_FELCA
MAFGGTRGFMPRWELPVGVAALLLLLFSVTAAQEPSVAACSQNTNRTCEECLKNVSCLWCNTNKACLDYPVTRILPPSSLCTLSSARWGVCWGGGEDRERPHQPESGRAGWLRRPVQNQETHAAEQADEGVLREAGACSPAEGQAVRVCAVRVSCVCAWVCAVRVHVLCARGCVQRVHHMCVPCVCACPACVRARGLPRGQLSGAPVGHRHQLFLVRTCHTACPSSGVWRVLLMQLGSRSAAEQ